MSHLSADTCKPGAQLIAQRQHIRVVAARHDVRDGILVGLRGRRKPRIIVGKPAATRTGRLRVGVEAGSAQDKIGGRAERQERRGLAHGRRQLLQLICVGPERGVQFAVGNFRAKEAKRLDERPEYVGRDRRADSGAPDAVQAGVLRDAFHAPLPERTPHVLELGVAVLLRLGDLAMLRVVNEVLYDGQEPLYARHHATALQHPLVLADRVVDGGRKDGRAVALGVLVVDGHVYVPGHPRVVRLDRHGELPAQHGIPLRKQVVETGTAAAQHSMRVDEPDGKGVVSESVVAVLPLAVRPRGGGLALSRLGALHGGFVGTRFAGHEVVVGVFLARPEPLRLEHRGHRRLAAPDPVGVGAGMELARLGVAAQRGVLVHLRVAVALEMQGRLVLELPVPARQVERVDEVLGRVAVQDLHGGVDDAARPAGIAEVIRGYGLLEGLERRGGDAHMGPVRTDEHAGPAVGAVVMGYDGLVRLRGERIASVLGVVGRTREHGFRGVEQRLDLERIPHNLPVAGAKTLLGEVMPVVERAGERLEDLGVCDVRSRGDDLLEIVDGGDRLAAFKSPLRDSRQSGKRRRDAGELVVDGVVGIEAALHHRGAVLAAVGGRERARVPEDDGHDGEVRRGQPLGDAHNVAEHVRLRTPVEVLRKHRGVGSLCLRRRKGVKHHAGHRGLGGVDAPADARAGQVFGERDLVEVLVDQPAGPRVDDESVVLGDLRERKVRDLVLGEHVDLGRREIQRHVGLRLGAEPLERAVVRDLRVDGSVGGLAAHLLLDRLVCLAVVVRHDVEKMPVHPPVDRGELRGVGRKERKIARRGEPGRAHRVLRRPVRGLPEPAVGLVRGLVPCLVLELRHRRRELDKLPVRLHGALGGLGGLVELLLELGVLRGKLGVGIDRGEDLLVVGAHPALQLALALPDVDAKRRGEHVADPLGATLAPPVSLDGGLDVGAAQPAQRDALLLPALQYALLLLARLAEPGDLLVGLGEVVAPAERNGSAVPQHVADVRRPGRALGVVVLGPHRRDGARDAGPHDGGDGERGGLGEQLPPAAFRNEQALNCGPYPLAEVLALRVEPEQLLDKIVVALLKHLADDAVVAHRLERLPRPLRVDVVPRHEVSGVYPEPPMHLAAEHALAVRLFERALHKALHIGAHCVGDFLRKPRLDDAGRNGDAQCRGVGDLRAKTPAQHIPCGGHPVLRHGRLERPPAEHLFDISADGAARLRGVCRVDESDADVESRYATACARELRTAGGRKARDTGRRPRHPRRQPDAPHEAVESAAGVLGSVLEEIEEHAVRLRGRHQLRVVILPRGLLQSERLASHELVARNRLGCEAQALRDRLAREEQRDAASPGAYGEIHRRLAERAAGLGYARSQHRRGLGPPAAEVQEPLGHRPPDRAPRRIPRTGKPGGPGQVREVRSHGILRQFRRHLVPETRCPCTVVDDVRCGHVHELPRVRGHRAGQVPYGRGVPEQGLGGNLLRSIQPCGDVVGNGGPDYLRGILERPGLCHACSAEADQVPDCRLRCLPARLGGKSLDGGGPGHAAEAAERAHLQHKRRRLPDDAAERVPAGAVRAHVLLLGPQGRLYRLVAGERFAALHLLEGVRRVTGGREVTAYRGEEPEERKLGEPRTFGEAVEKPVPVGTVAQFHQLGPVRILSEIISGIRRPVDQRVAALPPDGRDRLVMRPLKKRRSIRLRSHGQCGKACRGIISRQRLHVLLIVSHPEVS